MTHDGGAAEAEKNTAIDDLLAFGQGESASALKAKDRDKYQFWSGWTAALERVVRLRVALRAPQPQEDVIRGIPSQCSAAHHVSGLRCVLDHGHAGDHVTTNQWAASAVGDPPEGTRYATDEEFKASASRVMEKHRPSLEKLAASPEGKPA